MKPSTQEQIVRALGFAGHIHRNQKRKFSDNPFIVHPMHVALIVSQHTIDEDTLVSAILHDTIEDSEDGEKVTREVLAETFNERVARIVHDVSIRGEDTLESKQLSRRHILASGWESQVVKLADIISNTTNNLERLHIHSREEIEKVLGENLYDILSMNEEFVSNVTDEKVIGTGIVATAQESLKKMSEKIS